MKYLKRLLISILITAIGFIIIALQLVSIVLFPITFLVFMMISGNIKTSLNNTFDWGTALLGLISDKLNKFLLE